MGENGSRPDVCQGMCQSPTPFSIEVMIWDVIRSYRSCFSLALSVLEDIGTTPTTFFRILGSFQEAT
jgi:hypothetical protein